MLYIKPLPSFFLPAMDRTPHRRQRISQTERVENTQRKLIDAALQLLHEEIGLPEHKAVSLKTSINLDLGCNGMLLNPIFASSSHGYDTLDHYRIDPRLGDDSDFDELVAQARELLGVDWPLIGGAAIPAPPPATEGGGRPRANTALHKATNSTAEPMVNTKKGRMAHIHSGCSSAHQFGTWIKGTVFVICIAFLSFHLALARAAGPAGDGPVAATR